MPAPRPLPALLRVLPLAGWCATVWWLSSQTSDDLDGVGFSVPDWLAHGVEYAVGGFLARFAAVPWLGPGRRSTVAAVAFALAWGVLDEWHQSWVPGRDPSGTDVAADLVGAVLGAAAHAIAGGSENGARHPGE